MERELSLQLLLTDHAIDYRNAKNLLPPSGRVIVEMLPATKQIGRILLPDVVQGKFRPDVGIVLAVGPDVTLAPGSTVCVRGYDGLWVEGFDAGGYQTSNHVRVYGAAVAFVGEIQPVPWWDSVPLQIVQEGDDFNMIAVEHKVVIRRDPLEEKEGILWLREADKYRTGKGTVLSIGPAAQLIVEGGTVMVGDRIMYDVNGELDFAFGGDPDLAIIDDEAVWAKIAEEEVA